MMRFPENGEYFVSYYDYYQPEAYLGRDMYIDKLQMNERIEQERFLFASLVIGLM